MENNNNEISDNGSGTSTKTQDARQKKNDFIASLNSMANMQKLDQLAFFGNVLVKNARTYNTDANIEYTTYDSAKALKGQFNNLETRETCEYRKEVLGNIGSFLEDMYSEGKWSSFLHFYTRDNVRAEINRLIEDLEDAQETWVNKDVSEYEDAQDISSDADRVCDEAISYKENLDEIIAEVENFEEPLTNAQETLSNLEEFYQNAVDRLDTVISDAEDVRSGANAITDKGEELVSACDEFKDLQIDTQRLE